MTDFMPDAGTRDRLVEIQVRPTTDAVDASFAPTETWTLLYRGWFKRVDHAGGEMFRAHQITAPYETTWLGGYRADMDRELVADLPKLRRLKYLNRYYDIVDVQTIGRRLGIAIRTLAGGTAA
jgi:hypothetical protein